jgi:hypothetical protein
MKTRRIISLLLLIVFAVSAATGVLFSPAIKFIIGINDEGFWRYVHFISTNTLFGLIIIHILINIKALGSYLKTARVLSIAAFSLAVLLFAGVIYQGIAGSELGLTGPIYKQTVREIRSAPEPNLVTFPEDFQDSEADGWELGQGWKVELENVNYVLTCSSADWSLATPKAGDGWFDYTLEAKVKVIAGEFQLNFRTSERPYRSRYFLGANDGGFFLNRDINGKGSHLTGCPPCMDKNEWARLKVVLNGTNIKIYFNDTLLLNYTDSDVPLIFGGISVSSGPNSHILFDDFNVAVR